MRDIARHNSRSLGTNICLLSHTHTHAHARTNTHAHARAHARAHAYAHAYAHARAQPKVIGYKAEEMLSAWSGQELKQAGYAAHETKVTHVAGFAEAWEDIPAGVSEAGTTWFYGPDGVDASGQRGKAKWHLQGVGKASVVSAKRGLGDGCTGFIVLAENGNMEIENFTFNNSDGIANGIFLFANSTLACKNMVFRAPVDLDSNSNIITASNPGIKLTFDRCTFELGCRVTKGSDTEIIITDCTGEDRLELVSTGPRSAISWEHISAGVSEAGTTWFHGPDGVDASGQRGKAKWHLQGVGKASVVSAKRGLGDGCTGFIVLAENGNMEIENFTFNNSDGIANGIFLFANSTLACKNMVFRAPVDLDSNSNIITASNPGIKLTFDRCTFELGCRVTKGSDTEIIITDCTGEDKLELV